MLVITKIELMPDNETYMIVAEDFTKGESYPICTTRANLFFHLASAEQKPVVSNVADAADVVNPVKD